ncbi:MAG: hypothetical protein KF797_07605 [Flavobacteriales bacterium]|nr:hypothetical protein [Flavobacteriales bacterium]
MANERLGTKNIELPLSQYRAERKRLIFQLDRVRETIARLKATQAKETKAAPEEGEKRKAGRPRKADGAAPAKRAGRKRGRKKRTVTVGYRLSPWDDMVIAAITKEGLLPKETIVERAKSWAKTNAKKMTAPEVEVKVTRVLQKLSGKRGVLGTHRTGLRRGYHYGLKEWFFASTGALRKQHLDKLVLESKI